jgi:hypothetical protein
MAGVLPRHLLLADGNLARRRIASHDNEAKRKTEENAKESAAPYGSGSFQAHGVGQPRVTASIHMLLRLAQGAWPPPTALESCLRAFKERLQREQLRPWHSETLPGTSPPLSGLS